MGATWGLVVFAALLSCVCASFQFDATSWNTFLNGNTQTVGVDIQHVSSIVSGPNNLFYFLACPPSIGCSLFSTDGNPANPVKTVKTYFPSSAVDATPPHCCISSVVVNGKTEIWFAAKTFDANRVGTGLEPWRSDGTEAGTTMVANLDSASSNSLKSGKTVFLAVTNTLVAIVGDTNLYVFNAGTQATTQIAGTVAFSTAKSFIKVGTSPFIFYIAGAAGYKDIYKFDGTATPTSIQTLTGTLVYQKIFSIPTNNNNLGAVVSGVNPLQLHFYTTTGGAPIQPTFVFAALSATNFIVETSSTGAIYYGCYADAAALAANPRLGSVCRVDGSVAITGAATVAFQNTFPTKGFFAITANGQYAFAFTQPSISGTQYDFTQFDLTATTKTNIGAAAPQTQNFFSGYLSSAGTNFIVVFFTNFNGQTNTFWKLQGAAAPTVTMHGNSLAVAANLNSPPTLISPTKALFAYASSILVLDLAVAGPVAPAAIVLDSTKIGPFVAPSGAFAFTAYLGGKTFIPSKDNAGVARVYQVSSTGLTLPNLAPSLTLDGVGAPSFCLVNTKTGGVLLFISTNGANRDLFAFDGTTFSTLATGLPAPSTLTICTYVPSADKTFFSLSTPTAVELRVTDHKTVAGTTTITLPALNNVDTTIPFVWFNSKLYFGLASGGGSSLYSLTATAPYTPSPVMNGNAAVGIRSGYLIALGDAFLYFADTTVVQCFNSATNTFTSLPDFAGQTITFDTVPLAKLGSSIIFKENQNNRFIRVKACAADYGTAFPAALQEFWPSDGSSAPYFVYSERIAQKDNVYMIGENDPATKVVADFGDIISAAGVTNARKFYIHGRNLLFSGDDGTITGLKQVFRYAFPDGAGMKRALVNLPTQAFAFTGLGGTTPANTQVAGLITTNTNGGLVPLVRTAALAQNGLPALITPGSLTVTPALAANLPAVYKSVGPNNVAQQSHYPKTFTLQRAATDGWEVPFAKVNGLINTASVAAAAGTSTVDGTSTFFPFSANPAQPSVSFTYTPNFNWNVPVPALVNQFTLAAAVGNNEGASSGLAATISYKQYNFQTAPAFAPNPLKVDAAVKTTFILTPSNAELFYYIDQITNGQVTADNVAVPAAGGFVSAAAALAFTSTGVTAGSFRVRSATHNDAAVNPLTDIVANNEVVVAVQVNPSPTPSPSPSVSVSPSPSPSTGSGSGSGSTTQNLVTINVIFDKLISA